MKIFTLLILVIVANALQAQQVTYIKVYSNSSDSLEVEIAMEDGNVFFYQDSVNVEDTEEKRIAICTETTDAPSYTYYFSNYDLNASNTSNQSINLTITWSAINSENGDKDERGNYFYEFYTPLEDTLKLLTVVHDYHKVVRTDIVKSIGGSIYRLIAESQDINAIQLVNLSGQVWNLTREGGTINLEGFPTGVYVVHAKIKGRQYHQKIHHSD